MNLQSKKIIYERKRKICEENEESESDSENFSEDEQESIIDNSDSVDGDNEDDFFDDDDEEFGWEYPRVSLPKSSQNEHLPNNLLSIPLVSPSSVSFGALYKLIQSTTQQAPNLKARETALNFQEIKEFQILYTWFNSLFFYPTFVWVDSRQAIYL